VIAKTYLTLRWLSIGLITIGVFGGAFGYVRSGSIVIAVGVAINSLNRFVRSTKKRRVELIIPLGLAILLFVVALTLPHAK
jgi:hypothetical protein